MRRRVPAWWAANTKLLGFSCNLRLVHSLGTNDVKKNIACRMNSTASPCLALTTLRVWRASTIGQCHKRFAADRLAVNNPFHFLPKYAAPCASLWRRKALKGEGLTGLLVLLLMRGAP